MRSQRMGGGTPSVGRSVKWLGGSVIVSQLLVFAFLKDDGADGVPLYASWVAMSLDNLGQGRIWTLVTYGWVHDLSHVSHLLFNLLGLYFLARPLETRWGLGGMLHMWFVCVFSGGGVAALAQLAGADHAVVLGMSAGVMGLLASWSWLFPHQTILLMFVIPVRGRWVLPLALGFDVLLALYGSDIAVWAHLGGVLGAWLVLKGWTRPQLIRSKWLAHRAAKNRQRVKSRLKVIAGGRSDDEPMVH